MRITAVSLKNIKSYRDVDVAFPQGTIAITGPNGAGKSTLLEAIGFALFDSLPYRNQRDFMRHNAAEADVRVSFLSSIDECEYQAVRTLRRAGSGGDTVTSTYFVHSFATGERAAQQKQDVQDFLRRHVGLDDHDDLTRVFSNVLGVPQGRLTADFLLRPAQRKSTFDPLLQVDTYRLVYDRLRDVLDVLQGDISGHERRVAELEPEAARLPDQLEALAAYERQRADSAAQAQALAADRAALQKQLARLDAQRRTLEQQRDVVRQFAQQKRQLETRREQEQQQVDSAKSAAKLVTGSAAGHAAYRQGQSALAALEDERQAADALRTSRHSLENHRVARKTRLAALEKDVAAARSAVEERRTLAPQIAQQERLEEQARTFAADVNLARQAGAQVCNMLRRIANFAAGEQLVLSDGPPPAAAGEDAAYVREQLAEQSAFLQEIGQWLQQRHSCRQQRRLAERDRERAAAEVAQCRKARDAASQLAGLERQLQEVQQQISDLQAHRRFNQDSQRMAEDGLCPFFREHCPRVDDEGSLVPVIATLIRDSGGDTQHALAEKRALGEAVNRARDAQRQVDRLADLEPRLAALDEASQDLGRQERDLTQRIAEHLRIVWPPAAIEETIATLAAREQSLGSELNALGDPRRTAERLHGPAEEFEQRAQSLAATTEELGRIETALVDVNNRLAPFADLERRVAAARELMEKHHDAHDTFLRYQETAADLPRREATMTSLAGELEANSRSLAEARQLLADCEANWDPETLKSAQERLDATQNALGAAQERMRLLEAQIAQAQEEIVSLRQAAANLAAARRAHAEAEDIRNTTGFLRNVIRDAGPHITRHLIQQISAEANTLFSEILGDAAAELSLTEDYDIVLEQHGHQRGFAQLSGGEQMSAALAVRLGLLRQLSDINIAFFDEPTQNMDSARRHNLAEQLERVTGFQQLFVISHDDTFEPLVSTVLRVRKENGESMVEHI